MVGSYGLTFKFDPMLVCTGGMQDGDFANPQHRKWHGERDARA
jgi:hypothetical protein